MASGCVAIIKELVDTIACLFSGCALLGSNGRERHEDCRVNGRKLLGLYHTDVVAILKDLPMNVRLVCARSMQTAAQTDLVNNRLL